MNISQDIYTIIKSQLDVVPLLMVGEVHGVKNNIEFYTELIKLFDIDTLAIELPKNFLNTPNGKYPLDGRFSKEISELIGQTNLRVIYFDTEDTVATWNQRDEQMAKNFLAEFGPSHKTLLVAGNYHTKMTPIVNEKNETLYPMGFYLKQKLGNFPICTLRYLNGQFYNYDLQSFDDSSNNFSGESMIQTSEYEFEYTILDAKPITLL